MGVILHKILQCMKHASQLTGLYQFWALVGEDVETWSNVESVQLSSLDHATTVPQFTHKESELHVC